MLHVLAFASLGLLVPAGVSVAQTQTVRGATRASDRINDITDVQILSEEAGVTRILVEGTRPFTPEISTYKDSTIIALPGVWRAGPTGIRAVHKNGVAFVNCVQFASKPKRIVRIVASGESALRCELRATDSPRQWEIVLRDGTAAPAAPVAPETLNLEATIVSASKPLALPAPQNPWGQVATPPTSEAFWADADFEPQARSLTPTLAALDTVQRPIGMLMAAPEQVLPTLVAVAKKQEVVKGVGALAPVTISLPDTSVASTLPGLTAAAITAPTVSNKPKPVVAKPADSKKAPEAPRKRSSGPIDVEKTRVSLNLVDTDVTAVLKSIADYSGVNIIVSPEVTGKVTVSLRDVTVAEALSQIASIAKFEYLLKGQTFIVGSAERINKAAGDPELDTIGSEQIPFFYANPEDLKKALDQSFPNLTFTVVGVSAESKQVQTDPSTVGTTGAQNGPSSQTVKITPRGGVITIMASLERRKKARSFIENTERTIISGSLNESDRIKEQKRGYETELYQIHNSEPQSLVDLMKTLMPSISILIGPTPNFVGISGSGSASFSGGGSSAAGGSGSGGGSSSSAGSASPRPSTLIVTGPAAEVKEALEKLEKIDIKVPLLIFEAKLVEVNNDDRDKLGISYDLSRSVTIGEQNTGDAASFGGGQSGGGAGGGGTPGREFNGGAIFRTPYTINAALSALASQNKARILASPTLTALDSNPALGFIGDEIKYVSNIQQTQTGQNITTEVAKAGITLKVVGRVRPNGEIELLVHPEVSLIKNFIQLPNGVSLPQIATRYVDTTVRVKDGETIGIGGLLNEQDAESIQKVPFLSQLPILGRFFQNREKSKTRTELMVFITSRIVKD